MYVIIVGGGEVGYYLSRELIEAGHEVLVIEPDPREVERMEQELGVNTTMIGEGCRIQCLNEAGVSRADVFIAATDADENNLAACQLAMLKYKVPRVIAKLNRAHNRNIFRKLGIEHTVDLSDLLLENFKAQIPAFPFARVLTLGDVDMEVVQIRVTEDSPLVNKTIGETPLSRLAHSTCLSRMGAAPQPVSDSTRLEMGDTLVCVVARSDVEELRSHLSKIQPPV
ncbi:MAG TPA: TrkA family potassium uptake protein [Dehalococcoidia bacterium]|nr:TrkA family potassium uptake protein [Dehalococcoidia bacterium]